MLKCKDVIGDYFDKENTNKEQDNDAIEMPEALAEIEDKGKGSSHIS